MCQNVFNFIIFFYFFYSNKVFSCLCNTIIFNSINRNKVSKKLKKNNSIKKDIDKINDFLEDKISDSNKIEQSIFNSKIYNINPNLNFKINNDKENITIYVNKETEAITNNILFYIAIIEKKDSKLNLNFKTYITKINNIPCLYFKNENNKNKKNKKVLIFYHGNTEDLINILYYDKMSTIFNVFVALENDYDVIIPEFPGYSIYKSNDISEEKMKQDAEEIYNTIKNTYNKITVLGFSLGCSIAIDFASCENSSKINMLILTHPFASIKSTAKHICCCAGTCLKQRFKNYEKIKNVKCKTAILSASEDKVVPPKDAITLYNTLKKTNSNVNLYKYTSIHCLTDISKIKKLINDDNI